MLDTFKTRLKNKAKSLGVNLSQKRIDAIADRLHKKFPDITEEKDHDEKIEDFHEYQPLDELAREDDKLRNLEKKSKETPAHSDPPESGTPTPSKEQPTKKDEDTPAWAKTLIDEVKTLKAERTQATIKEKLAARLKDKVPEKYYQRWALPEKEDDLESFATEVEADYNDLMQEKNNQGFAASSPPGGGTGQPPAGSAKTAAIDQDIKAWAAKKQKTAEAVRQQQQPASANSQS